MNSLNIISSRVSPQNSPAPSRTNSYGSLNLMRSTNDSQDQSSQPSTPDPETPPEFAPLSIPLDEPETTISMLATAPNLLIDADKPFDPTETSPLLSENNMHIYGWASIPKRIVSTVIGSLRWFFSIIATPGFLLLSLFYDDDGSFRWSLPPRKFFRLLGLSSSNKASRPKEKEKHRHAIKHKRKNISSTTTGHKNNSTISISDSDAASSRQVSRASREILDSALSNRSIRIKVQSSDEALKERRHRKTSSVARIKDDTLFVDNISAQIKSPTSPSTAITKYPRAPAPPRPLIPRRQPSYLNMEGPPSDNQKTLILDLDETLIHSMSKGNRLGSGHMVEVRLTTTFVGQGGQTAVGPQHPILYYVHKRPYCDDFLRRVSKWYKLVIFTASVQEYADPVIDWLETDRKYFAARYYRQHCTYRQGAFIKDLSAVEPDLSKVMILDNSPLSYMFHQDNAIPISGWISDPTDYDLLHLIPLLEGLQYVSDVRALLALRGGEDGQHMA